MLRAFRTDTEGMPAVAAQTVTSQLLSTVRDLPPERQKELLELIRIWASAQTTGEHRPQDPVNRLHASGRLDHDYLALARAELRSPPDLATVRAKLARISGSLTEDCIAERDERF